MYSEIIETSLKEILKDPNKLHLILCSQIRRLGMVKMTVLPKMVYRFKAIRIECEHAYL